MNRFTKTSVDLIIIVLLVAAGLGALRIFELGKTESQRTTTSPGFIDVRTILITYSSTVDEAKYGNYNFKYPGIFTIQTDKVKIINNAKRHVVILADRIPGVSATIEIGAGACSSYRYCTEVSGTPIGTNSSDDSVVSAWGDIAKNIKIIAPPPVTRGG